MSSQENYINRSIKKKSSLKLSTNQLENFKKKCGIKFININESPNPHQKKIRKDLETKFIHIDDNENDIYLNEINKVNHIEPTKELINEVKEIVNNNNDNNNNNYRNIKRKLSFQCNRDIKKELEKLNKNNDLDELDENEMEETIKNTFINRIVGELKKDNN